MKPITASLLAKSRRLLDNAALALSVGLAEDAGRNAYLSAYTAARALLYQREGRLFKTHNGVQSEFARLVRDDSRFDRDMRVFLSQAYNLKQIADYEDGPDVGITGPRASSAIEQGARFLACCENAAAAISED